MKIGTTDINNVYIGSTAINTVYIGTTQIFPNASSLLLDTYSGAAVAYSLRKLRYNYSGSAIRVRRSSDNTEQDIGFLNNQLDTTSLTIFCIGTDGFIVTWYDQSGNGNNATQSTAANQPQIVSSGSVLTLNGKPRLSFDGVNDGLSHSSISGIYFNAFIVNKIDTPTVRYNTLITGRITNTGSFSNYGYSIIEDNNVNLLYFNTRDGASSGTNINYTNTNNQVIVSAYNDSAGSGSSTMKIFENNTEKATISTANPIQYLGTNRYTIGWENSTYPFYLDGDLQEVIIYTNNQTSNRSGIESNINTYYGVY